MKKILLFLAITLLGISQMTAQKSEYTPFVREGVQWVCYFEHYWDVDYMGFKPGQTFFTLEFKGDAVIDGKSYKAMHKYSGIGVDPEDDTILAYLREEGGIVYAIIPEGMANDSYKVGYGDLLDGSLYNAAQSGQEIILYDFNDTESYYNYVFWRHLDELSYNGVDMVDVDGKNVNRHSFSYRDRDFYFIEGIGYDGFYQGYPLSYLCSLSSDIYPYYLSHVVKDGKIIYKGLNYMKPAPYDGRMPMVCEGTQWVFEKVIIDHGVATSEYYTYEVRGDDPRGVPSSDNYEVFFRGSKLCRYYRGMKQGGSEGEIVCSLREIDSFAYPVYAIDNTVMDKVASEGRNLLRRMKPSDAYDNVDELYWFNHKYPEQKISRYIGLQLSPKVLTTDNFKLIEPVEIDGYSCNRYAYVDENGEPQCYVIEGIGFDSRDMGDLLAPFTRRPDPDADYQEYCGLSHVIKDGKIIYKGMRYDADRVELNLYDVDGDGQVNIADVTALIDLLLNPDMQMKNHADVDASGELNIADVTSLVDYLLSK